MKRIISVLMVGFFVMAAVPLPTFAGFSERDATYLCEKELQDSYGYSRYEDVTVKAADNGGFKVKGKTGTGNVMTNEFVCKAIHGEVTSVKLPKIDPATKSSTSGGSSLSTGQAAAIGAGVLGLAVLAAVAAKGSKDSSSSATGNPFDDKENLKRVCAREIKSHLEHEEHGIVSSLDIKYAHLDGRDLRGDAHIKWDDGVQSDISFTCQFDRSGKIHDGEYRYAHR